MEPTPMALDERLSAYLDGELAPTAVADLEARIAQDPALAVRVQELRNVSTLLRSAYAAPVDAYGSTHLRPPMPVAAPRPLSRRHVFAAAASIAGLALAGGVGAWILRHHEQLQQAAHHHPDAFASSLTALAEQHHTLARAGIGPDIGRNRPGADNPPDLAGAGLALTGATLFQVDAEAASALLYRHTNGAIVSLSRLPCAMPGRPTELAQRGDLHLAHWCNGHHFIVAISDLGAATTRHIAQLAARQLAG